MAVKSKAVCNVCNVCNAVLRHFYRSADLLEHVTLAVTVHITLIYLKGCATLYHCLYVFAYLMTLAYIAVS